MEGTKGQIETHNGLCASAHENLATSGQKSKSAGNATPSIGNSEGNWATPSIGNIEGNCEGNWAHKCDSDSSSDEWSKFC